jgi:hypothetical protein
VLEAHTLLELKRHEAKEHRRRLMQGLGASIISMESHGYRLVAVGSQIRWSNAWRTFPDFLFDFIKDKLTPAWGNTELAKFGEKAHPLIRWYRKLCQFQQDHANTGNDGIFSGIMTGAVKAYLDLAYHLYLAAHNAELPERLLKRLRNREQFEGALYEAFVIGHYAKAGFQIDFEDEDDATSSHCEFVAIHKQTGRKFSVEAKTVTTASKRSGTSDEPPNIRGHLYEALRKDAAHPRIIFIELNRAHKSMPDGVPEWFPYVETQLKDCEQELTINGESAPSAYVFITNRAFMHDLDAPVTNDVCVATGFKIQDFPPHRGAHSMLELYHSRQRHIEVHWLLKAILMHHEIPTTFDDRLPEEVFDELPEARLRIGDTYLVPDGSGNDILGVLCDAVVLPPHKNANGIYRLADGRHIHCSVPLTEAERNLYLRSPETFFGVIKHLPNGINEPLDAFDFVYETYSKSSREKLLEFMAKLPDIERLSSLNQSELAEYYSAAIASKIWDDVVNGRTKLTDSSEAA